MQKAKAAKNLIGIVILFAALLLVLFYYMKEINRPREFQQGVFVQALNNEYLQYKGGIACIVLRNINMENINKL